MPVTDEFHRALATAARMHAFYYNIGYQSHVAQFTAYIWMPCTTEIISTLIYGGRVCIPSDSDRLNNPAGFMRDHQVTLAHLTPSFLGPILPSEIPSLKVLGLGGEKVPKDMIERWSSSAKVIIGYGSTESNLALLQLAGSAPQDVASRFSGGSICWIVEQGNCERLAPIGTEGELLVESWALARGYLNNAEKSASTFIQTPEWLQRFRSGKPTKICRLGDTARYNQDGSIQILGRRDDMIKIRGQKVDVAEVEAQIKRYFPTATRIAVEASSRSGNEQDTRLIAFLVIEPAPNARNRSMAVDPGFATQVAKLKADLSLSLSSFMVPSFFVPIQSLPLTGTGKLDRQKLKIMASNFAAEEFATLLHAAESLTLPSTHIERSLAHSWSSLLNVKEDLIRRESNFFSLGGNSLFAMRLVSEARTFGLLLTVETIFKHPTLDDMASIGVATIGNTTEPNVLPFGLLGDSGTAAMSKEEISRFCNLESENIEDAYPPTGLQLGLVALALKRPGDYLVRSSFILQSSIDLKRFQEAWEELLRLCPIFRTRFVQTSSGMLQVIIREEAEWANYISPEIWETGCSQAVIKEGGRLTRFAIQKDQNGGYRFHCTIHHALLDVSALLAFYDRLITAPCSVLKRALDVIYC